MHNLNEGELSHRLGGFSQIFVVDDESAEDLRREKERSTIIVSGHLKLDGHSSGPGAISTT